MTGRLEGRVAIVVGAAQGIGAGIVERFIEEGAIVAIGDMNEEAGRRAARRLGGDRLLFQQTDVSKESDVTSLVSATIERFGCLDILVQNAGIYPVSLIEETTEAQWDLILSVNLKGTFFAARACVAPMRSRGGGRMVFTSSITGPRVASLGVGAYAASKAGINGFIRAAALEFARFGITVNGVEPGNILTEGVTAGRSPAFIEGMTRAIPMGRIGTPRDVANATLFLASEEASFITGTTIIVDGGQILPESADAMSDDAWR
jgi:3-oxoacyl-[acyl-carrier protein] reductase